jgi:hypothetical protein
MTIYVTSTGKNDGVGSQTLSKILAIIYSKHNNYVYAHTPYQTIDIREQDNSGLKALLANKWNEWVIKWEDFFNLGHQEINVNHLKKNGNLDLTVDLTDVLKTGQITMKDNYLWHNFDPTSIINKYINENKGKNILFLIKEFPKIDTYPESLVNDVILNMRSKYNMNIKPDLPYFNNDSNKTQLNIAIHKRHTRGNKYKSGMDLNSLNSRITFNKFYLDIIEYIYNNFKNKNFNKEINLNFVIFTDGNNNDFPELVINDNSTAKYNNINIKLMMGTDSMDTIHYFSNADILIMDKSSFSFVGALYNKNTIITNPYWDKSLSKWIDINNIDFDNLMIN